MTLNVGDTGYSSVPVPGLSTSTGASESTPLLISECESEQGWRPLSKEQLEVAAGGPGWRKVRCYLVLLFWLAWVAMLATSIAIVVMSPRPVVTPLRWWQKTLFYQLQPETTKEKQSEGADSITGEYGLTLCPLVALQGHDKVSRLDFRAGGQGSALCEQLPYLKSLGIGALILDGLYDESPLNISSRGRLKTLSQMQQLLAESSKAGLKVVLDFCKLDVAGDSDESLSLSVMHILRFWLEQGVAGFAICDTDAAYSEKTLLEWRGVFKEFSSQGEERILVVKQTQDVRSPLNNSTVVDVVMRSILPPSHHFLSAREVAVAIETHLQTREEEIWPSWTVGGKASHDLKKLLLVLMMTLPGSPAVQHDEDIELIQKVPLTDDLSQEATDAEPEKNKSSTAALFSSLSRSRAREEALLYGSFTFLPFNSSSTNSSSNSTLAASSSPPILAFLRSWGCVHFLILLNVGPEVHTLNPAWASSLPEAGVFVTSTGLDRLGTMTLASLQLQPHEAIVIKLFEGGSYS